VSKRWQAQSGQVSSESRIGVGVGGGRWELVGGVVEGVGWRLIGLAQASGRDRRRERGSGPGRGRVHPLRLRPVSGGLLVPGLVGDPAGIHCSVTRCCNARIMARWTSGEVLAFDLETTGIDRFNDVPVSYALVLVRGGIMAYSWSGLIDPGRDIPADATAVHGITSERARAEGMPLDLAVAVITDAIVAAGRRGVPVAGMKLDYDLTMIDTQARLWWGHGLSERGWTGPVLDASVIDRHVDPDRNGPRTLTNLCAHYGVHLGHAHDASADAVASAGVLFALAEQYREVGECDLSHLHDGQIGWHRQWAQGYDEVRFTQCKGPLDPRDYVWPVAPAALPPAA
jgi:DNA polymerase-3 subunit epsilon